MATAKRTASGKWKITVFVGYDSEGKRKYKSFTDGDKRKCERVAAQYLDEHRGIVNKDSFESAMSDYIASRKAVLSPATIRGYKNVEKQLKNQYGAFCAIPVQDINQDVLQALVNEMTVLVSPKTVRNRHGLITAVIKNKGYMPPMVKLPNLKRPVLKIPDVDDVKRILSEAEGSEMEIPILLGAFAPLRRSEISALTIDDIEGDVIHVTKAIVMDENGKNVLKGTKTYDSSRSILMPHYIIEKILTKGYVTTITNPQHISQRFEHIANRAGCKGTRFHDLRHFCASYLHSIGVPEQYILARGGWTTDGVMKNVYRHTLESGEDKVGKDIIKSITDVFNPDSTVS